MENSRTVPNSRFPFQQSHTSLTHPSLPTEWHMSFITGGCQAAGARGGSLASAATVATWQRGRAPVLGGCQSHQRGDVPSYYLLSRLVWPPEDSPLLFFSLTLFPFFFSFPPVFFLSLAVGTNWLTHIIQAAPACWGLCKWIWELLVSHDSNVHYWRWMFLKKRLMMDIRLIVPFIILNII